MLIYLRGNGNIQTSNKQKKNDSLNYKWVIIVDMIGLLLFLMTQKNNCEDRNQWEAIFFSKSLFNLHTQ